MRGAAGRGSPPGLGPWVVARRRPRGPGRLLAGRAAAGHSLAAVDERDVGIQRIELGAAERGAAAAARARAAGAAAVRHAVAAAVKRAATRREQRRGHAHGSWLRQPKAVGGGEGTGAARWAGAGWRGAAGGRSAAACGHRGSAAAGRKGPGTARTPTPRSHVCVVRVIVAIGAEAVAAVSLGRDERRPRARARPRAGRVGRARGGRPQQAVEEAHSRSAARLPPGGSKQERAGAG
jgi:hypothetical protein